MPRGCDCTRNLLLYLCGNFAKVPRGCDCTRNLSLFLCGIFQKVPRGCDSILFVFCSLSCFDTKNRCCLGDSDISKSPRACDALCVKRKKVCDANCVVFLQSPAVGKRSLIQISRKNLSGYFQFKITRKNLFGDLKMGAPGERVGMRAHVRASARACERGIA